MLLTRLGLPDDTVTASVRTRLNGEPLNWNTCGESVGQGHWKLGMTLKREEEHKQFRWTTWTVENGSHVANFECTVTPNGDILEGWVNCFALGCMPLDQGYLDQLLSEYEEDGVSWETITN